jgi:drug/metabolite transporter (DMT)-like permease
MTMLSFKTISCTCLALLAFAANSILCRIALRGEMIDAASFTVIRLLSGIIVLVIVVSLTKNNNPQTSKGSWLASFMLILYAVTFSYAYVSLDTGTGALILFAAVQFTMISVGIITGNKLRHFEWFGLIIAFSGFIYLVLPSLTTPSLASFILMVIAGIAWAIYTLYGRGSTNPIRDTAFNFFRTLPIVIILLIVTIKGAHLTQQGVFYAILSGAVASAMGYAVWYIALNGLTVTQAAVLQLLVPVIAAVGGVIFASEIISLRLLLASVMVLGGILTVLIGKYYVEKSRQQIKNK